MVKRHNLNPKVFQLIKLKKKISDKNSLENKTLKIKRRIYHLLKELQLLPYIRKVRLQKFQITGPSGSAGDLTSTKSINENSTAVHTFTEGETGETV